MEFAPSLDIIINETLPALQKVQQSGKARFIGITGYPLGNFRYKTLCLSSLFLLLSCYFFQFFFYKIILNWGNSFLKLYYIFKNIVYDCIFLKMKKNVLKTLRVISLFVNTLIFLKRCIIFKSRYFSNYHNERIYC